MNGTIWYEYDAARTDVLAKRNDECTRPSRRRAHADTFRRPPSLSTVTVLVRSLSLL